MTAAVEADDPAEPTHADHHEPDEDCFDCQEAVAQMWSQMMEPY